MRKITFNVCYVILRNKQKINKGFENISQKCFTFNIELTSKILRFISLFSKQKVINSIEILARPKNIDQNILLNIDQLGYSNI